MSEDTQTTQQDRIKELKQYISNIKGKGFPNIPQPDSLKRLNQLEQEIHDLRGMIMELQAKKVKEGEDY